MLKETFIELLTRYKADADLVKELWNEIELNYSYKKRHYHTLAHLENMLVELSKIKAEIKDWDVILFSLYYHDIIYNSLKKDNEEKSASLAQQRLTAIGVSVPAIAECTQQIIATKMHLLASDNDTNFFTDADLCILAKPWDLYAAYYKQIRKEYAIYPDIIYNPGRKKVLQHFLQMERIYKTGYFFEKYELQAKQNIQQELEQL